MPGGKAPLVREKNSVAYMHPRTLANLKSPEQVATKLFLTPERLMQLADAELAPHYRIDGGGPKFSLSEIRDWVLEHLVTREDGRQDVALRINVCSPLERPHLLDVPQSIRGVDNLRVLPLMPAGVYFLCDGPDVVYVGQSVTPASRVESHRGMSGGSKTFDRVYFLPVPREELNAVEAAFIRALKPRLNGTTTKQGEGDISPYMMPPASLPANREP